MKLAIIGAGTVGKSVAQLANSFGHTVVAVADSSSSVVNDSGITVAEALDTKQESGTIGDEDPEAALHADYDCLIEVTPTTLGTAEPAFSHIETALHRERHVVLGNKGPIAQRYSDVQKLADESAGTVQFEAAVGGSYAVISTIRDIGPDRVLGVRGVFNGLANFILSRMAAEGLGYEHVLAEAQDLGIAEVDPTFDVEGTDSALTCCILANVLADGRTEYTIDDVEVEGITGIQGSALKLAREDGRTVRLLGEARGDHLQVAPRIVPENSNLAVTGSQTVVELDLRDAGKLNVSSSATTSRDVATAILTDVNRLENR